MLSRDESAESLPSAARLEEGELLPFFTCPFQMSNDDELAFLRAQTPVAAAAQEISFDPRTAQISAMRIATDAPRLTRILADFANRAREWLSSVLPEYSRQVHFERIILRTEEEATRRLPVHTRNDLLHIDTPTDGAAAGERLLRLFINIDPAAPRVWQTSETFPGLLQRYAAKNRIPVLSETEWRLPLHGLQRLLQRDWSGRPAYDCFMMRLQQFLRLDESFQERAAKRVWRFSPGSAWLLFADGLSHAVLRGQYALSYTTLVPVSALVAPQASPLRLLVSAGAHTQHRRAG